MPEPPAAVIRSLMYRDPVDPSLQAGIGIEILDPAKNLDKYFLGSVGGVGRIAVSEKIVSVSPMGGNFPLRASMASRASRTTSGDPLRVLSILERSMEAKSPS